MTNEQRLMEELAAIEHERWADWQRYVHSNGKEYRDGTFRLPHELYRQWKRQINTPYSELSEAEKNSDREQVDRYWPLIQQYLKEDCEALREKIEEWMSGPIDLLLSHHCASDSACELADKLNIELSKLSKLLELPENNE